MFLQSQCGKILYIKRTIFIESVSYMKKWNDLIRDKYKQMSLKRMYYTLFVIFIVVPIFSILLIALLVLNKQFKNQAIENIRQSQETVIAELTSDIDSMSMRLANLIYANDGEILGYAAETDTNDSDKRYENMQKLENAEKLSFEPSKDIISIYFYMKDGKSTYLKNYLELSRDEIRQEKWYQTALAAPNNICIGYFDGKDSKSLYSGSSSDMLILSLSMCPNVQVDRSQKIEMVTLYYASNAATRIKNNNQEYAVGKNNFGISRIVDSEGNVVFSFSKEEIGEETSGYTCISAPVSVYNDTWYVENYIKTSELTQDYWSIAAIILLVAAAVILLVTYFSRFFLKSIVRPVEAVNHGLKQVEEGILDVYITPSGQNEIQNMIHQFNAMVRQQKVLLQEYEDKVRKAGKAPEDYLKAMVSKTMEPEAVAAETSDFFHEPYQLIGITLDYYGTNCDENVMAGKIAKGFLRNSRFASCCRMLEISSRFFLVYCRASDEMYLSRTKRMLEELFRMAFVESGVLLYSCVSVKKKGSSEFYTGLEEIQNKMKMRHLGGKHTVLMLEQEEETYGMVKSDWILAHYTEFEKLAEALFLADEKNMAQEKGRLFEILNYVDNDQGKMCAYAVIIAVGERFSREMSSFAELFGKHYNYLAKIDAIADNKELKIWLTNYFAWIMNYSSSKLEKVETDVIVKAKRYISDHFDDTELSLKQVADSVGLNEKYFTNKFTKEAGETFSDYLTGVRMQKAKELLRTTSFKVYEIAEMIGYNNF